MKQLLLLFLLPFAGCHQPQRAPVITADSLQRFDRYDQQTLSDDINRLNDVYKQQIALAEESDDDSIRYYKNQLELAQAAGKNMYVQFALERKMDLWKLDAAKKGMAVAAKHAKREMDMVYASKFREQKEKELFDLQKQLDSNSISQMQYDIAATKIKSRVDKSPVTDENAVQMSMDYNKQKYAEALNSEQKLLEAKIDSESKH